MSITSQESSVYIPIIGTEDFVKHSPDLAINPAVNDLSNTVNLLHQRLVMLQDNSKQPITAKSIITEYNKMKQDRSNNFLFARLDNIASQLGANICNTFNTIQYDIKPTVDKLQTKIEQMTAKSMEEDEVVDDNGDTTTEVETSDFDKIEGTMNGEENICENFKAMSGLKADFNFKNIYLLYKNRTFAVDNINMDDETEKENLERFETEEGASVQDTEMVWRLITNNRALSAYAYDLFAESALNGNYIKCMTNMSEAVDKVYPILLKFQRFTLNTSDAVNEVFRKNLQKVFNVITTGAYTLMAIKNTYNKNDALVIAGDSKKILLNADVANQAHLSNDAIIRHMRIKYFKDEKPIPRNGVKAKEVKENEEKEEQEFEKDKATKQIRTASKRRNAMSKAMSTVLYDYLVNTNPDKLPKGVDGKQFAKENAGVIKAFANRLESTSDRNLQNSLYEFVINIWHRNTPVAAAHKLFGQEVVKQLSLKPSLESIDVKMIDTSVAVEIATNFLVNRLCTVK